MIVTAHQPNFLPGMSVISKIQRSDAVIWLDQVQYSHGGWSNRNRAPNGCWMTVPVDRRTDMAPFNEVLIREHGDWKQKIIKTLQQQYTKDAVERIAQTILRPHELLISLNIELLGHIIPPWQSQVFQSHIDSFNAVTAISEDPEELKPISLRLAKMVKLVGGTHYLSGPSGRNYLDETPFKDRGILVEYYSFTGPNDCCACLLDKYS